MCGVGMGVAGVRSAAGAPTASAVTFHGGEDACVRGTRVPVVRISISLCVVLGARCAW